MNAIADNGKTALMHAAQCGFYTTVRFLMKEANASVELLDNRGRTALSITLEAIAKKQARRLKMVSGYFPTATLLLTESKFLSFEDMQLVIVNHTYVHVIIKVICAHDFIFKGR